ncbi:MAG: deoxyribonuclease IV [Lachnospiraceae bacterium]|nr:deoxyribonuclease IV [Lachnospiraceae bacterium]
MLGSHVGLSGKEQFLGSVKEALSYGADTFMVYTGAPQNTIRKKLEDMRIDEAKALMAESGISEFVVHAPYIINLGNTVKPESFEFSVEFLREELRRTSVMGSRTLVLHPGSHVGEGEDAGIMQIIRGINETLDADTEAHIALETMAGKGSELGKTFEQLARIYDGVIHNNKLRLCLDTCHLNDAGYNVKDDFEGVLEQMTRYFPINQVACIHLNDSKNEQGAAKDRHENIGFGTIGFDRLCAITRMKEFANTPIILETPYMSAEEGGKDRTYAPYREEIAMLRKGVFNPELHKAVLASVQK